MTPWGTTPSYSAAARGCLALLIWLQQNDCPWSAAAYSVAARAGHTNVSAWMIIGRPTGVVGRSAHEATSTNVAWGGARASTSVSTGILRALKVVDICSYSIAQRGYLRVMLLTSTPVQYESNTKYSKIMHTKPKMMIVQAKP